MGGVFLVKKWTFHQGRVHYVQYQYSYFTFYLFGGCVRTQCTPLPAGLYCINQQCFIQCDSSSMNLSTRQADTSSYTAETDAACQPKCTEAVHC